MPCSILSTHPILAANPIHGLHRLNVCDSSLSSLTGLRGLSLAGCFPLSWCPTDSFGLIHGRQSLKDFTKIVGGIDIKFAASFDEAVNDGTGLAGVRAAEEEKVLFADGRGTDGVLDEVVVDLEPSMLEVKVECIPAFEGVVDRFAKVALRQLSGPLGFEDGFYPFQNRG